MEKGPRQDIAIKNRLKVNKEIIEKYEVDRREATRKAAGNGDACRRGKQQKARGPTVAAASETAAKVYVGG